MHLFLKIEAAIAGPSSTFSTSSLQPVRVLVIAVLLGALSACGDAINSDPSIAPAPAATSVESPGVVQTSAPKRQPSVTIGSMGGSLILDDRTGAVYSIALREGGAFLEGAAVLRGAQRGWYTNNINTESQTMRNPGIGGSLGPHLVLVTPKADALWVDDSLEVSLADGNVVLFEGAGAGEGVTQVGSLSIDSYLGPAPIEDARQRRNLVQERLAELLRSSRSVRAAWTN